jgi:hypothetical protein
VFSSRTRSFRRKEQHMLNLPAVLRIHDILVGIHASDMDPDPVFLVIDLYDANLKLILKKVFLLKTF